MNPEELFKVIHDLMQAGSMEELEKVLNNHPELLGEEVDDLLLRLASTAREDGDTNAGNLFSQIRELLQTARASRESSRDESGLSAILEELSRPARLVDMPKRIDLCQRALELVSRERNAELWAALQNDLANSLAQSPQGDRAENIEQAIERYSLALKIYTQKDFPEQWATIQNNLALAYWSRIKGDRAENIELAIEHYSLALKIYTPKGFPNRCRGTSYRLGNLFLEVQRYSPAADAYIMGMEAVEELYRASIFQASREAELAETRDLYRRAGYVLG